MTPATRSAIQSTKARPSLHGTGSPYPDPAFAPPDLARVLREESVTALFAAPAHVAACLDVGLPSAEELSSLRLAVMAGSAVPPAIAKGLQERIGNGHVTQL